MLNICGITYDHTVNYGSNLQAYALQEAIKSLKLLHEVKANYSLIPSRIFDYFPLRGRLISIIAVRITQIPFLKFYKRIKNADISSIRELDKLLASTDAFVCGSDVVWSPDFNDGIDAFYLRFSTKYSFSYAASFGKANLSNEYLESLDDKLSKLNTIGVREKSGVKIIKENTNREAVEVVDPVLLLPAEKWESIAVFPRKRKDYIFVYLTHINDVAEAFIDKLGKQTGLRVIRATYGPKQALKYKSFPVSPEKWLGLILGAKYVVTNSFHATAFSTLFHKKFFTVVKGEKSGGINIRMNDFLSDLGLQDRLYSSVPENIDLGDIDFFNADKVIEEKREYSMQFLRDNLEVAYKEKIER